MIAKWAYCLNARNCLLSHILTGASYISTPRDEIFRLKKIADLGFSINFNRLLFLSKYRQRVSIVRISGL